MVFFSWIIVGILFGVVTQMLDRTDAKGGLLGAIGFGVAGSLLGGLGAMYLFGPTREFDFTFFLIALSGTVLLLLFHRTAFSNQERF